MTERQARRGLGLLVAIFCALCVVHNVAVPLFEAPDELWHFSFIRFLATERRLPVQPREGKDMWLREAGQPPLYYVLSAPFLAPLDTTDFPDFVRFNVAHPAVTNDSTSQAPNVFIHTRQEAFPYRRSILAVHVMRLLTIAWGAATVVGGTLVVRAVVPGRSRLALAAAAVTALNPHFVYISSVVNNDATVACLATFALWLSIRLAKGETGRRLEAGLGLVLGLALLSKVSGLALLPVAGLALGLAWWRDRDWPALLTRAGIVFGLAGLVSGWWYGRNWLLYGDPLAWDVWLEDIGRQPITLIELIRQLGHVATSYWSPYDGLFPGWVFGPLALLTVAAAAGWARLALRRQARAGISIEGLLLAGTWFLLLFASLIRYMTTTPSAEGRLLFPATAAFSLFVVLGLDALVPRRWIDPVTGSVAAGLLILSIYSPLGAIGPRYALPLVREGRTVEMQATFADATFDTVRLLGMQVEPETARAGERVEATVYWETLAPPPADLRAVVQVWTLGGRFAGQRDAIAAGESYPPDLWQPGDVVRDGHWLDLTSEAGPAMCRVTVDVLAGDDPLGQVSSPPLLRLEGPPVAEEQIPHPVDYTLGQGIGLVGYDAPSGLPLPGRPLTVTLYWRSRAPVEEDYTVFVHLIADDGERIGQGDGPPLDGDYPTSFWEPGEVLADPHTVLLEGEGSPAAHLVVGLYRLADGVRLPAYDRNGERVQDDGIRLNWPTP